tara:strand:+ start:215 stop:610 length:396 start_codon:yes stop_codon:yes gene_type:complete
MEPLDAAWSILKRQRPHPSLAAQQPKNVFDNEMNRARIKDAEKKNEIKQLQEALADRTPARRGNEGMMRRQRQAMARRLRELQAENEPEEGTRPPSTSASNVDPRFEQSVATILGIDDDGNEYPVHRNLVG